MNEYSAELKEEIRKALIADKNFDFRQQGNKLRLGTCPQCGERECFVDLEQPFRVSCGRLNNCRWSATTRELYPEIFENVSARHPATEQNPNASADAYMQEVRGFDLAKIRGMYVQGYAKNPQKHEFYPTVKIVITKDCYWQRLINADDVRKNGAKSKIVGDYKDLCWMPDKMTIEAGDTVWIVEGIFKAMALWCIGIKAVSPLSCSNFPRKLIAENKQKDITWVIAEDSDTAGTDAAAKYAKELTGLHENFRIAFPAQGEDWDDAYQDGKLTPEYINDSFWRGFYYLADLPIKKAFYYYCKTKRSHHVFDFRRSMYRCKVDAEKLRDDNQVNYPDPELGWNLPNSTINKFLAKFANAAELKEICPAKLNFLYIEQDILTKERQNCLSVEFANNTPAMLMTADGTIYKSADNFSNALLKSTGFAPFNGNMSDLTELHNLWFKKAVKFVRGVPFIGFEPESKIYIFPDFAYCGGQYQKVNTHGYVSFGAKSLKVNLAGLTLTKTPDDFNPDWIRDYYTAFDKNGIVLLAWWLGTLFAEQIRERQDSWTFLEYTGEPGSGKSTQIKFCWRLLGIDNYEGFDPNKTTPSGRARQMSQVSNLPVILLEGDREETSARKNLRAFDFNELKDMFNQGASIRTMGVQTGGNETKKLIFHGGILITQNAEVKATEAVLSRIVHCHVTKSHFNADNAKLADKLKQMTSRQLGGFIHAALRNEKKLLAEFYKNYEMVRAEFDRRNTNNVVPEWRLRHCHAQLGGWALTLPTIFGNRLSKEQLDSVIDHLWLRAQDRQQKLASDHPDLERFWEVYEYIHIRRGQDGGNVELLNHSRQANRIAINLPQMLELAAQHRLQLPETADLTVLFKIGRKHKYIDYKQVRSSISSRILKCWIFEKDPNEDNFLAKEYEK